MGNVRNVIFLDKEDISKLINNLLKVRPTMEEDDVVSIVQDINDIECKIYVFSLR